MSKPSAQGVFIRVLAQLRRAKTRAQLKVALDEITPQLVVLTTEQRMTVFQKITEATARWDRRKVPAQFSVKVRAWDERWIARIRAAEARNGCDWANARELGIPYHAARLARYKYVGRRTAARPPKALGVAATPGAPQEAQGSPYKATSPEATVAPEVSRAA